MDQRQKPRRGCLFYGGIIAVVLFLFLLVGALLGLRLAKRMFSQFTDTKPMPLPSAQMPPAEFKQLQDRIDSFRQAVREHRPTPPLALSANELNALIANDSDLQQLKGKIFVSMKGDKNFAFQLLEIRVVGDE